MLRSLFFVGTAVLVAGSAFAQEKPSRDEVMRKAGAVYLAAQECATFKNDPLMLENQIKATSRTIGKSGLYMTVGEIMQASTEVRQLYGSGQFSSEVTGQAACDLVDEALE